MLPPLIENILTLRDETGAQVAEENMNQTIIPNFPALASLTYNLAPPPMIYRQIYYEIAFGQAMVPHSFDIRMFSGGTKVFDAIVSGRFTQGGIFDMFEIIDPSHPLQVIVTNLRAVDNYYELTLQFLDIKLGQNWDMTNDYLTRFHLMQAGGKS